MKGPGIRITDHAVLRYLERVRGMDIEAVRREIAHTVRVADGHPGCTGVIKGPMVYKLSPCGTSVLTVMRKRSR